MKVFHLAMKNAEMHFEPVLYLTHFLHVWHTCVVNCVSIHSNNGLSPVRCQDITWHNAYLSTGPLGQTSVKFESKYKTFHSWKCLWKYRLRNSGHFVRGMLSKQKLCCSWLSPCTQCFINGSYWIPTPFSDSMAKYLISNERVASWLQVCSRT